MYSYKEPKAMEEIHKIRIKFYGEDKGLSNRDKVKKTNEIAKRMLRKYGLAGVGAGLVSARKKG